MFPETKSRETLRIKKRSTFGAPIKTPRPIFRPVFKLVSADKDTDQELVYMHLVLNFDF